MNDPDIGDLPFFVYVETDDHRSFGIVLARLFRVVKMAADPLGK